MKSDERHELKQNDLAAGLHDLPTLWSRHGNKLLLLVTAALLVYFAVRYRHNQALQREAETRNALANAWAGVEQVQRYAMLPASAEVEKMRGALTADVNQSVQAVLDDPAATPEQQAWAWLARGELYWAVSRDARPPTTGPATAPATGPAADPLALAANAYASVVKDYAATGEPAKIARFSLAAVAEDGGDWPAARTQYKALIETADISAVDKAMATARLAKLDSIEKPTLLLPATQPAPEKAAVDTLSQMPAGPMLSGGGTTFLPSTRPAASPPASRPAATRPAS